MAAARKYPVELKERAVGMVRDLERELGPGRGAIARVAQQLGVNPEALRYWLRQDDQGRRPSGERVAGSMSEADARIAELERENRELRRANEILKAASAFFRTGTGPSTAEIAGFVDTYSGEFGVAPVCEVIGFAVSTYYATKKRQEQPSDRRLRDEELIPEIRAVWEQQGKGMYGARKVWKQLLREGVKVARCTVERLMRAEGMTGVVATRHRPRTTIPGSADTRPRDLVERDFRAPAPNQLWVTDVTYVDILDGDFCYTAFVTDVFSRAIVGWQVSDNLRTELALDALDMALWSRREHLSKALVHHSDRGVQYTSIRYGKRLADAGIERSVGSTGDSYDNALAESVNALYKKELIGRNGPWKNAAEVTLATAEWVYWYNHERLHSWCGDRPPMEFEQAFWQRRHVQPPTAA
nr:IS3 family transposase [Saccharopolyspora sp. ASAGF58]